MKNIIALVAVLTPGLVLAQPAGIRALYEAGKHEEVVEAVGNNAAAEPSDVYLAAQSSQKISNNDAANELYTRLAGRDDADPWRHIGESALAISRNNAVAAVTSARRAEELGGDLSYAHYQLGMAYVNQQDFQAASTAFERASELDPGMAYAHYNAGLMYYRVKRIDKMASHFEMFLKLAPEAPERGQVESIMRTVRGR